MRQETVNLILWGALATPAIIGAAIAYLNGEKVNGGTETTVAWVRKKHQSFSQRDGFFAKYIVNPVLWSVVKLSGWTDGISHRGVKSGIRVASLLYFIAAWLFALYVAAIIIFVLIAVAVAGWIISRVSGDSEKTHELTPTKKKGSWLFPTECSKCGSDEHATKDCPHGLFSSKCGKCGSTDHATSDCPHGLFSSKCGKCGSTAHATSDCPQGLFSSKCGKCGSTEHATSDCPHGFLSSKCSKCGSIDHATRDCPH